MSQIHNEGYESPNGPNRNYQQTPEMSRNRNNERNTNKRPRSNISPLVQQHAENFRQPGLAQQPMTHPATLNPKLSFPPIVVKFKGEQKASIKEITDDLISKWKVQHGIDLSLTARFGHMHSLLIFVDDSSTFESLLDPKRWPKTLKEIDSEVNIPRQLPPEYSLVIQQFHRNWNEEEWLDELQQRYVSLYKITRLRVKDGSPLNAVRADFKSIEEVKTLIKSGKIHIGSMIHTVKPYYLPVRINKCLKCLRHDHTTKSCTRPRVCPRCAEEHSLEHGCPNNEKCINCNGNHISGHSACPIVQEKRRALLEQSKIKRAELLVRAEHQQHHFELQKNDYPKLPNDSTNLTAANTLFPPTSSSQRTYVQSVMNQNDQDARKNIEHTLLSFLNQMERRLDEFSSRLSLQLCNIERKMNAIVDRHYEIEKLVGEVVLPSFQDFCNIISQTTKNRTTLEEIKQLDEKIKSALRHHMLLNRKDCQSTSTLTDPINSYDLQQ